MSDAARAEAELRYPPDHMVPDPDGATGEAHTDEYGYEEYARTAFLAGVEWQSSQAFTSEARAELIEELEAVIELVKPLSDEPYPPHSVWGLFKRAADALSTQPASSEGEATAKAIAASIRASCTVPSDVAVAGGDRIVYAVADWIENPPEWVHASWKATPERIEPESERCPGCGSISKDAWGRDIRTPMLDVCRDSWHEAGVTEKADE